MYKARRAEVGWVASVGWVKARSAVPTPYCLVTRTFRVGFASLSPPYYYHVFGNAQVRLLQNVDDPAKLIQEIEYEADEGWELNRQRIAGDVRMQTFLQTWRTMFPTALEIDVFQEI